MRQIIPALYSITSAYTAQVFLIEDPDGLTLIDAGLASAPARIIRRIKAMGYKPTDVKRILITHAHPDHIGGLLELKRLTGADVITSAGERLYVEGKEPAPRPPKESLSGLGRLVNITPAKARGTPVDCVVEDGETLSEVMGGLQAIVTAGHTPGHIAFWQPEKRVLFCGDMMVNIAGLRLPPAAFTVDMDENRRSIRRVAGLGAEIVCFGHGPVLERDAAERLQRFAERLGD